MWTSNQTSNISAASEILCWFSGSPQSCMCVTSFQLMNLTEMFKINEAKPEISFFIFQAFVFFFFLCASIKLKRGEAAARSQLQKVLGSIKYVTDVWDITTCCLASVWSYIRTYRPEVSGNASEMTLIISLQGVFWKRRQRCFYKSTSIRVSVTHI